MTDKTGKFLAINDCLDILGDKKVVTAEQAAELWRFSPPANVPVHYALETLESCAKKNQQGCKWWLVYINGLSLLKQREIIGTDSKHSPYFFDFDEEWWERESNEEWVAYKFPHEGYYLFDLSGDFGSKDFFGQDLYIDSRRRQGEKVIRTDVQILCEALASIYYTHHFMPMDCSHRGDKLDSQNSRSRIGVFANQKGGISVCTPSAGPLGKHPTIKAVLCLEWEEDER